MLDKIENMIKKSEFKLTMQQIHDLDSINELSLPDNIKLQYFTIIILENQKIKNPSPKNLYFFKMYFRDHIKDLTYFP